MTSQTPPTPRARSARLPRTARRTQLLGAAREVFVDKGYHATAMDEIAERAGVSKPVLYQHFPGKYDLYLALIDQHTVELTDLVLAALASTSDNKLRVAAAIGAYFDYIDREGESFRLIFESDLTNDAQVRNRVDSVTRTCAHAIAVVICEDAGLELQAGELLGIALGGVAHVTARYWFETGRTMPRDEAARLVTQLTWAGIRGFPKKDGTPFGGPDDFEAETGTITLAETGTPDGPAARALADAPATTLG